MNQYLVVRLIELKSLFKHLPMQDRLQLEGQLRQVFHQIDAAMNWKAPPAQPPQA